MLSSNQENMDNKIKIGVSSCLIGEKVRWNGDHKQDRYVKETLNQFFEYVPVCPEVEVGMGTPRETVALYGTLENPKMLSKKTQTDWTRKMDKYAKGRIKDLSKDDLCGYIFKSKSPSCGLARIPVYDELDKSKARHGVGMFAEAFTKANPLVPTEDEGGLNDTRIRENFIVRVFSFFRLKTELLNKKARPGTLVQFHTEHKFLLLAHSRKHYQVLGKIVAEVKNIPWNRVLSSYISTFMEALTLKSTPKKNTDVLLHMMGFLKKILTKEEKKEIFDAIEDYRNELIPFIVPMTLVRHQVKKHNIEYLLNQVYLNPHPKELMLRNHV
jgi:uncharacterized protein YbgA (DUF1722 family)/uncharacterized protein YbbK (DUF523 family)